MIATLPSISDAPLAYFIAFAGLTGIGLLSHHFEENRLKQVERLKKRKERMADPICGNCGKPRSEHYHENEIYCFRDTTGDLFTEEPNESFIADMIDEGTWNEAVRKWKFENGHMNEPSK